MSPNVPADRRQAARHDIEAGFTGELAFAHHELCTRGDEVRVVLSVKAVVHDASWTVAKILGDCTNSANDARVKQSTKPLATSEASSRSANSNKSCGPHFTADQHRS